MSFLSLNGTELYYSDSLSDKAGSTSQPTILFVNGWALSSQYWQPLCQELPNFLKAPFRFITHDHSGTGSTRRKSVQNSDKKIQISDFIDESCDLIESLQLGVSTPLHIVGHSMGSIIAAGIPYALQQRRLKSKTDSLTIIACGIFKYSPIQMSILSAFINTSISLKWLFNLEFFQKSFIRKATSQPIPQQYERIVVNDFMNTDSDTTVAVGMASLDPKILALYESHLIQYEAPMHLCVGDEDKTIPPEGMTTLFQVRSTKSSARTAFSRFSNLGHLPMLEDTKGFAAELAKFYNSISNY
ncbi:MAG: alpha/beta hydrolase [Chloroherpetonaceae bacterium]|nr:alpha/beta hydrolase [Chloroherpetonaceae bacterium]